MKFQYRYTLYEIRLKAYFFKISTIWFLVKTSQIPSSSFLKCTVPDAITVTLLHNRTAHRSIFLLT